MIIFYLCIFFLGAAVASFINATLYRIDKKYKYPEIITKGSHCEKCDHSLTWWELVPVLGYVLTKGKCSQCKKKINLYYPISELYLGLSFLLFYLYSTPFYYYFVLIFLFILSYFDFKDMGIPKNLTHIFLGICVLIYIFTFNISNLLFPLFIALTFFVINLIKKSFGIGDILVILSIGILLSQHQFLIFFWGTILIALIYAMAYILVKKVNVKGTKVPLIPFMSIAFTLAIVFGEALATSLLNFMGM